MLNLYAFMGILYNEHINVLKLCFVQSLQQEKTMIEKAFVVIAASCGYLAWSKFCENAGINEPIANAAGKLVEFASNKAKEASEKFQKNMKTDEKAVPAPAKN